MSEWGRRHARGGDGRHCCCTIEPLEPRLLLATFTVTNTADDGAGSLRDAIVQANVLADADVIEFNIPGAGVHTIQPLSELPTIRYPLTIDGFSQTGAKPNTNTIDKASNAVFTIELDGSQIVAPDEFGRDALTISAGDVTVRGLVVNRFQHHGIIVSAIATNIVIAGNYIGTDVSGSFDFGNNGIGVFILNGADNTRVGGTNPQDRNIISGNNAGGILIGNANTNGTLVQGNFIGVSASGLSPIPNNGNGIAVNGAPTGFIGGVDTQARNIVSGNTGEGIAITNGSPGYTIQGNYIGTDITGQGALPNGRSGIILTDNLFGAVSDNIIGGENPGEGNTIAFNGGAGVRIVEYGMATLPVNNRISGNSIHSNASLGIDLIAGVAPDGNFTDEITANDEGDADGGPNNLQNFPVLTASRAGGSVIDGTLNSVPSTTFRLQFFANHSVDPLGNGEGEFFLGAVDVVTDANGDVMFNAFLDAPAPDGYAFITATATDPDGNTSEFSNAVEVTNGDLIVTNTDDAGVGSLRDAIAEANVQPGADIIRFNISGAGPFTIAPLTNLPDITDDLTINGMSQPGFSDAPIITLDGAAVVGAAFGLAFVNADLSVSSLNFTNWTAGVQLQSATTESVDVVLENLVISDTTGGIGVRATGADTGTTFTIRDYQYIGQNSGIALIGSRGTFLFDDVSLSGGDSLGAPKFLVNGGAPDVLLNGTIAGGASVQGTAGGLIDIAADFTAGYALVEDNTGPVAVLLSGESKVLDGGVALRNSPTSIVRITNGGLNVNTLNATALEATGGGFLEVSGPNNNVSATGGIAIDAQSVDLDVTLHSVTSTNSPGNGIDIGVATGTLTVTGATVITGATNAGLEMTVSSLKLNLLGDTTVTGSRGGLYFSANNSADVRVVGDAVDILNSTDRGISVTGGGDFAFSNVNIDTPAGHGVNVALTTGQVTFDGLKVHNVTGIFSAINSSNNSGTELYHNIELTDVEARAVNVQNQTGQIAFVDGLIDPIGSDALAVHNARSLLVQGLTLSDIGSNGIDVTDDQVVGTARFIDNTVTSTLFSGLFYSGLAAGTHTVVIDGNTVSAPTDTQFAESGVGIVAGVGVTITLDMSNNTSSGNVNEPSAFTLTGGGTVNLVFLPQDGDIAAVFASRGNVGPIDFSGVTVNPAGDFIPPTANLNEIPADVVDKALYLRTPQKRIVIDIVDRAARDTDVVGADLPLFNPLPDASNIALTLNGTLIPINVTFEQDTIQDGQPATGRIIVTPQNSAVLVDGEYFLTVSDSITDASGNALDGDDDGVVGGIYATNFTVDSRPEIAIVYRVGDYVIDLNGNDQFDTIAPQLGVSYDLARNGITLGDAATDARGFTGAFTAQDGGGKQNTDGFDRLAFYDVDAAQGFYRWLVDLDNDGKITEGTDLIHEQPANGLIDGQPFSGNFDSNADNGDEVGLYDPATGMWYLDSNGDYLIDGSDTMIQGNKSGGWGFTGDFDGDGLTDLGHYDPATHGMSFDLANDGLGGNFGHSIDFSNLNLSGVNDRPVAGDFDQDGVNDIGVWSPAATEGEQGEWLLLLSNTQGNPPTPGDLSHFSSAPVAADLTFNAFADFNAATGGGAPVIGNFDPRGLLAPNDPHIDLNGPDNAGFARFENNSDLLNHTSTAVNPLSDVTVLDEASLFVVTADVSGPLTGVSFAFGAAGKPAIGSVSSFVIDNLSGAMTAQEVQDMLAGAQLNVTRQPGATGAGRVVTRVKVTDAQGKTQQTVVVNAFDVNDDMTAPSVTITSPQSGVQVVEGGAVPITVDATDDVQIARVELLVNNVVVATDETFPYVFDFTSPQVNSKTDFQIIARAVDTSDNATNSVPITITSLNNAPPTVTITFPTQGGSYFEGQMIEIAADATDDAGVTSVEFFVNGVSIGVDTTAPYAAFWTFAEGVTDVTFGAVVTDTANQLTNAIPVDVTVSVPGQRSISGTVFEDFDADNTIDAGDTGLANVDVILRSTDGSGVNITVQTGPDGAFIFPDPEPGEYEVEIVAPSTYLHSLQAVTQVLVQDSQTVLLGGLYRAAQLHVPKWHDILGDGLDATDVRLNGFEVRLYNAGSIIAGEEVAVGVTHSHDDNNNGTIELDERGIAWFTDIRPGFYDLIEVVPEGWDALNGDDAGTLDGDVLHGHLNVEVRSGDNITDLFFLNRPQIGLTLDYGDAPDPTYPTLLASDGARHILSGGFLLGATVDAEGDGQPSTAADGDGADEDGVDLSGTVLVPGTMTTYTVTVPATGKLDAWIDFNGDGVWSIDEKIADSLPIVNDGVGPITVPVTASVPANAVSGQTYARFRFSRNGGLDPTGLAPNGEVEDYIVTIGRSKTEIAVIGKASPGGSTKTVIDDGRGNIFDISLKGAGQAVISQFDDNGRLTIDLVGTDLKSQFTIKKKSKTGDSIIEALTGDGDLAKVTAKGISFFGDILIDGYVKSFTGGDVALDRLIRFGGAATDKVSKLVFGYFTDVTLTSGAPIDLTLIGWADHDQNQNPDSLTAPYAKKITVKGDKKNAILSAWQADLILTGEGNPKQTLGAFNAEAVSQAVFDVSGDTGAVTIKTEVEDATLDFTGAVKSLKLGDVLDTTISAASTGAVQVVRWINGAAAFTDVKSIKTKGDKKTNKAGDLNMTLTVNAGGLSTSKSPLGGAAVAGALSGNWRVNGPTGNISAGDVTESFVGLFDGDVKALTSKGAFNGYAAAYSFGKVDVKTTMDAATIIAGGPAGSADANFIKSFKVGGAVSDFTRIFVGVDPVDGFFDNGNDVFKAGDTNLIKNMTIRGDAAADSTFRAGAFPKSVSINKVKVDPLGDDRFTVS